MKLLTTAELTKRLGLKKGTVEHWRVRGIGPPYIKQGDSPQAHIRYRLSDVIKWEEEHKVL